MIKSMTGFGKCNGIQGDISFLVELKAVNHRYLEIQQKLSYGYGFLEDKIKSFLKEKISRGKLDVFVSIDVINSDLCTIDVNHGLVSSYVSALKEISQKYEVSFDVGASFIAKCSDVLSVKTLSVDEEKVWNALKPFLAQAVTSLLNMRESEGLNIKNDLEFRAKKIIDMFSSIEPLSCESCEKYKQRLEKRILELLPIDDIAKQRITTEAAIFADKSDVTEEIIRLRSHFEQFFKLLNSDEAVGRKLDFLVQEINREVNTIGSKSSNTEISHIVVEIKAELEKIREQVQNIE